jgi:hypothetical protein
MVLLPWDIIDNVFGPNSCFKILEEFLFCDQIHFQIWGLRHKKYLLKEWFEDIENSVPDSGWWKTWSMSFDHKNDDKLVFETSENVRL